MPTKENIEWMERVFAIASQFVEVQRAIERVDAELATQRTRLGLPPGGGEKGGERKKEEQTQGTERSVPAAASTASGTESRPLRSSSVCASYPWPILSLSSASAKANHVGFIRGYCIYHAQTDEDMIVKVVYFVIRMTDRNEERARWRQSHQLSM